MTRQTRELLVFHLAFAAASAAALAVPAPVALGPRVFASVLLYNLALPLFALRRGHTEWFELWRFLLPLSILQIFPDWILAAQIGSITFPDHSVWRVGAVPAYMGLMWTIPLFLTVALGERVARSIPTWTGVAVVSLGLFAGAELALTKIPLWIAIDVHTIAGMAWYILGPEILLGIATWVAWRSTRRRNPALRLAAATAVMIFYAGATVLSYFLIERVLLA